MVDIDILLQALRISAPIPNSKHTSTTTIRIIAAAAE
jgi:hypothetical protein